MSALVLLLAVVGHELDDLDRRRTANRQLLIETARRLGMSPSLLLAVAETESNFDDRAVSPKGAVGLMQVMPETGREVAARLGLRFYSLDSAEDNALIGATYLRELTGQYRGDLHLALAAYNAGPKRVNEWRRRAGRGAPGDRVVRLYAFRETRQYVSRILAARRRFAAKL